jgi:hypothetical protein
MNNKLHKLTVLIISSLAAETASAQVIGYVNTVFGAGNTLFENPLLNSTDNLTNLFNQGVPNGTTISLWNTTQSSFVITSKYLNGSWTLDLILDPGNGAQLNTPSAFTNTFVGNVLNHDGSLYNGQQLPPPVFSGPNGTYLLGDKSPTPETGTDIFLNIFGRLPNGGEQVTTFSGTSTYLGNGEWDNVPTLGTGLAAFFTIEAVPEPGAGSLFSICTLFVCWCMRRHKKQPQPATGTVLITSRRWLATLDSLRTWKE